MKEYYILSVSTENDQVLAIQRWNVLRLSHSSRHMTYRLNKAQFDQILAFLALSEYGLTLISANPIEVRKTTSEEYFERLP